MHAALVRGGEQCSPELVRDLMRELGLEPNGLALTGLWCDTAGDVGSWVIA